MGGWPRLQSIQASRHGILMRSDEYGAPLMALKEILYQKDYRGGCDEIADVFFRPALEQAQHYWRATGYFSSSILEAFGKPLGTFVKNGGRIKLMTSIELFPDDLEAIKKGMKKKDVCLRNIERIIDEKLSEGVGRGVERLSQLLSFDRLELRVAVPKNGTGVYHEKMGIFLDNNDYVAFSGSINGKSCNASENNRECVDVYLSWDNDCGRAQSKREHFETVWNGMDDGVDVFGISEAIKDKLIRFCTTPNAAGGLGTTPRSNNTHPHNGALGSRAIKERDTNKKWRHQDDACEKFLAAERGILNMATGTGKTRTAIKIMETLLSKGKIDTVVISTDGNDLLDQWCRELYRHRWRSVRIFKSYGKSKTVQDFLLNPKGAFILISRKTTHSALGGLSANRGCRTLLVHDEVHRLGSEGNRNQLKGLSDHIRYRLGLSATPERPYDDEGNQFIENHIGPVLISFGLREAIGRGILSPFRYFPLTYEPDEEDRARIKSIQTQRYASEKSGIPMSEIEISIKLAKVYKTSKTKLPIFKEFICKHSELLRRCIIFVETKEYGQHVLEIIHEFRSDFHSYFSDTDKSTLQRFARKDLGCLITCHRLSEGIDIHSLNTVILFSSEKGRLETIQRIGRCLRTDPENPNKIANIIDFVRESTNNTDNQNADEMRRDWLLELSRLRETDGNVRI